MTRAPDLNSIKQSLQYALGKRFTLYQLQLRDWFGQTKSLTDLEFNLAPIFKDDSTIIQLHNSYLTAILQSCNIVEQPPTHHTHLTDEQALPLIEPPSPSSAVPVKDSLYGGQKQYSQPDRNHNEISVATPATFSAGNHLKKSNDFRVFRGGKRKVSQQPQVNHHPQLLSPETQVAASNSKPCANLYQVNFQQISLKRKFDELEWNDDEMNEEDVVDDDDEDDETVKDLEQMDVVDGTETSKPLSPEHDNYFESFEDVELMNESSGSSEDEEDEVLPAEKYSQATPVRYLHDIMESSSSPIGKRSVEIIPNVTHISKSLSKHIEKEGHLENYFIQRKGPDQPYLTTNASVHGKFLHTVWQYGLINIQTSAMELIIQASYDNMRSILTSLIKRRKSFKVDQGTFCHSFGEDLPNPYLTHPGYGEQHEFCPETTELADVMQFPNKILTEEERERKAAYNLSTTIRNQNERLTKIGPLELYETIQANKYLIPSNKIRMKLCEQLLGKISGYHQSPLNEDERNNNTRSWNYDASYVEDYDQDEEGELLPICSY